ncbi:MAG: MFS transporter [Gammaproteobacteria bacterium]|nr:MFS transporter [Gammaproteobacteria bacterium]
MQDNNKNWDTDYEWKVILLLGLGFALVGMDRFVIGALWPTISADLGIDPGAIGTLAGFTGITWGVFAIIFGRLADKWGHRKIIIGSVLAFSLFGGLTGIAAGLTMLVLIRSLLGVTEGAYTPTSFTATAVAGKPSRRGLLQGLQQCGLPLLGLGLSPIIATILLNAGLSWRVIFVLIAAPGFIVALLLWKVLREPKDTMGAADLGIGEQVGSIGIGEFIAGLAAPLKSYNIVVCTIALLGSMCGLFTLAAFLPTYLEVVLGIGLLEMGLITSAVGFGGFFGQIGWSGVSDKIGRKPTAMIGFAASAISLYWFMQVDSGTMALFLPLFITSFFTLGNITLITGPISTESAPGGMVAASIGVTVGIGEIFGGGLGPITGTLVVPTLGLSGPLYVALGGMVIAFFISLMLKETAPIKVGKPGPSAIDESGPVA